MVVNGLTFTVVEQSILLFWLIAFLLAWTKSTEYHLPFARDKFPQEAVYLSTTDRPTPSLNQSPHMSYKWLK